ncbi:hypothetical protein [Lysinibacillus sp. G4S2]|uniref:hypothetical protein n=1 Tax=Lysinibacillus sp. G4S2 TaxID=3055859 RepID=UPI0025A0F906|nr:hypothetical protein [Lysinibacillus sp. G4S2]MDM5247716.1 hypothetical protein [Lysinibacillus sp. G4S2]
MRKLLIVLLCSIIVLSACNPTLAITEVKSVPKDLQETLNVLGMEDYVQMINNGEKRSYIVINTKDTVTVSVESKEDAIVINIDEVENQNDEVIKQHIYKLTVDANYEYIYLYKNGEQIPFNIVGAKEWQKEIAATERTEQPTDRNAKVTDRNSGDGKQGLIDG